MFSCCARQGKYILGLGNCENMCTLSYYHHQIRSMTHCHCLGLGHETMVCTICLFIFLIIFFVIESVDSTNGPDTPNYLGHGTAFLSAHDLYFLSLGHEWLLANSIVADLHFNNETVSDLDLTNEIICVNSCRIMTSVNYQASTQGADSI